MPIEAFCTSRLADGRAETTVEWYRRHLGAFESWLGHSVDDATIAEVEGYLAARRRDGLKPTSLHAIYRSLKAYYRWAQPRRYVTESPVELLGKRRLPRQHARRATLEQYEQLLASCNAGDWLAARDRLILMLSFFSGLRVAELVALHVADLNLEHGVLLVRSGKGGDARMVPIHPGVRGVLVEYLFLRPPWAGPELLLASCGASDSQGVRGPLTTGGVRMMLGRRCRQVGITRINPHALRHGFATTLLNAGASVAAISRMMGHSSTKVTEMVYATWLEEGLTREYDEALKRLRS